MIPASPLQERISERIVASFVVASIPQFQEQIVEIVFIFSGAYSAAHWEQIVDFPVLFFGIFLFSVEVEKFLVCRAQVREDSVR